MDREKNYRSFYKNTDFIIFDNRNWNHRLVNRKRKYILEVNKNRRLPKTGILFVDVLDKIEFRKGSKVLDVGTGDTGILAVHCWACGADEVTGIDISAVSIKEARINARRNRMNMYFYCKSIFKYKPKKKFDLIISNPPLMPVKKYNSSHDDGGKDGKKLINELIPFSAKYLKKKGILLFSLFDFLGTDCSYNNQASIFDLLKDFGFKARIIKKQRRFVSSTSYTYKNKRWIESVYPNFKFKKIKNGYCHYFYLVKAVKV